MMFTAAVVLTPGQTIATFQHTSQHCWPNICELRPNDRNIWTQRIATLLGATLRAFGHPVATCCTMLGIVNRTSVHFRAQHCCANLTKRLQHHATSTVVAWKIWPFSNLGRQHPTCRNRVAKCAQHAATNNDEICYVERLLSFGQDSTLHIPFCLLVGRQVHISTILLVWRRLVVYAH